MKIFIDSADLGEIQEIASWGILSGATTNPSLIAKSGKDFHENIKNICTIVKGPVSAECMESETFNMVTEGLSLVALDPNVVVKIPLTVAGLKAVKILSGMEVKTNVTLCFSADQGLLAAQAGATYVSVFVGRLDDNKCSGIEVVKELVEILKKGKFSTEVISASIRNRRHVIDSALVGAHIATVPYNILISLVEHPLTTAGIERFTLDWEKFKNR